MSRTVRLWLFSLALVFLHACSDGDKPASKSHRERPPVPVAVAQVVAGPLEGEQTISGRLEPIRHVRIFNQEAGRVLELPWEVGDRVRRGELLVRIDDRLLQAQLRKARANLAQAQGDRQRLESLFRQKLVSEEDIARADTAIKLAQAEVSQLETRLAHTRILAPFDAVISERRIEPGDVAPLNTHLLTLIDPARLKAVVYLPERLAEGLAPDQPVQLRIDALGDRFLDGRILRLTPGVDRQSLKQRIEIAFPPPAGALPGQFVRVRLPVRTASRLHVPFVAVRHDSHGAYVYRLGDDRRVHKQRIVTGLQLGKRIAVRKGLAAGEQVVVKGFTGLRDGRAVRVAGGDG